MVKYTCARCKKEFKQKCDYGDHINRKNPCEIIEEIQPTMKNIMDKMDVVIKSNETLTKSFTKKLDKFTKINETLTKSFTKKIDKLTKINDDLINKIKKNEKVNIIRNSATNDVNTDNIGIMGKIAIVTNNNDQIVVVAHGKENLTALTDKEKQLIISNGSHAVIKFVEVVFCNDDKLENKNIYISSKKNMNNNIMVYNGIKWELSSKDSIDDLRKKGIQFMKEQYEIFKKRKDISDKDMKIVKQFLDQMNNANTHALNQMNKQMNSDIKILLYNNRPDGRTRLVKPKPLDIKSIAHTVELKDNMSVDYKNKAKYDINNYKIKKYSTPCIGVNGTCPLNRKKHGSYDNYCTLCFCHLFPDDDRAQNIRGRTKEIKVVNYICHTHKCENNWYYNTPIYINFEDGCCPTQRRIDLYQMIENTMLCIEIDENQHKSYPSEDDFVRYNEFVCDMTCKYIFIRYNPDKYKINGKNIDTKEDNRFARLSKEINKQVKRIKNSDNEDLLEIVYLFYDE